MINVNYILKWVVIMLLVVTALIFAAKEYTPELFGIMPVAPTAGIISVFVCRWILNTNHVQE